MSQFSLLKQRRFAPFFWTQALSAFNDNAFRNALLMLLAFQSGLDDHVVSLYSNLAPALFILPFCLLSATGGQLAEKYEKTRIVRYVQWFEIVAMVIAGIGFITHNVPLLLLILFMMGVHSTLFGPIKYAILPQVLRSNELVGGNGLVEMSTQLAILVGMIAGNELMRVVGAGPWLSALATIVVAIAGYLASRAMPPAPPTAPDLQMNWNPLAETRRVIGMTHSNRHVWIAVLGISWFWFFGTVLMAQLPVYTRETLGGNGSVYTLVLTLFSVGSGIGALLCEKLSTSRIDIGLVPFGALGMTVFGVDLYLARHGLSSVRGLDWLDFMHGEGSMRLMLDLTFIGLFASLYVVPLFAFMQSCAPPQQLSRMVAGNNIMNALLIILAAGFGLLLGALGCSAATIFLCAIVLNVLVSVGLFIMLPEFVMRFMSWIVTHILYRLWTEGVEHIPDEGPAILLCHPVSVVDAIMLGARLQRRVCFVMQDIPANRLLRFIFVKAQAMLVVSAKADRAELERVIDAVGGLLGAGELVCLLANREGACDAKVGRRLDLFPVPLEKILARQVLPTLPILLIALRRDHLEKLRRSETRSRGEALLKRLPVRVILRVDTPVLARSANAAAMEARMRELVTDLG